MIFIKEIPMPKPLAKTQCKCGNILVFHEPYPATCKCCGRLVYPTKRIEFKIKLIRERRKKKYEQSNSNGKPNKSH